MVNGDFAKLTRKHGIKISAGFACTVEEIGLAVGEKVGHGSIKSLARMNSAVVIFLDQVEKVNCVIETGITRKGEFSSLRQWWDHGKTEIRLLCQQHTLNVTQDIIRSMKDLESDIVELETISETTGDRGYIEILKEKKMALANLLDVKVQGALVRSRFLNTNEMDAPTSFFFGLEKKNGQRRVIHSLLSGTGQEITEPSQIRRRAVSFYSTLYTSEYEEGETLSEGFCNGLPQVSEEANSQLEGPLTIQELQTALQGMQGRRAPGIDGLSVEFYKAYWDVLSHDLLDVFNESLASGSMPVSCRRAVITLLPKKGNLQDIKNWRPVSLLCVDYKILSKALATRLGKAVEQVIHRDQTYCVPGRSMVDNVHLIRDVLEVSSSLDINTGLISLDQEKAFDRVEHSFLWKVMEKFGFSAGFIAKIKVLYNKIESVLKFNARLDVSSSETPGLTVALCRSKTLCLQQLVDAVGPELSDAQALGSLLGLHSVRVAQRILQLWSQILCPEEKRLLRSYGQGGARPDPADPFPEIYLSPGLGELTGPLLQTLSLSRSRIKLLFTSIKTKRHEIKSDPTPFGYEDTLRGTIAAVAARKRQSAIIADTKSACNTLPVPRSASQPGWNQKRLPSMDNEDFETIPSSAEELSNSSEEEGSNKHSDSVRFRVQLTYESCAAKDLSLESGDLVQFLEEAENGNWLVKKLLTEETGLVPASILQSASEG
ncbi:hypothetical protein NHX12_033611, partial [Muraenolepis orangiensis]